MARRPAYVYNGSGWDEIGDPSKLPLTGGTVTGATAVEANSSSSTPLTLKGAAGQTANLLTVEDSAGTDLVVVEPSGAVGIGTDNPDASLHVARSDSAQPVRITNVSGVAGPQITLEGRAGGYGSGVLFASRLSDTNELKEMARIVADGEAAWNSTAANQDARLSFRTTLDGTTTERMRINSAGLITGTGTSLGAWTAYTPTLGGWSLGDGAMSAYYCQIGKIVHYRLAIAAGSTTTFGSLSFTYPVAATSNTNVAHHSFWARDNSAGQNYALGWQPSNSTTCLVRATGGANGLMSATSTTAPFTWAAGDVLYLAGTYEAN